MRVKITTLAILTIFTFLLTIPVPAVSEDTINWKSYDEGIALAKEQGKKIVVFFSASWCSYCAKMKKTTFKNDKVIKYLNDNYIPIIVNSDKERELVSSYGVRGLPTMWFLKEDTTKLSNMPGYIDAKIMISILKYLHTDAYQKMSFKDFVKTL